jgi:sirohydrochlorin cobaltochelatase
LSLPSTTGLIVFAHGSRVVAANEAVEAVAVEAARRAQIPTFRAAFLELASPNLGEAVEQLARQGVRHILITPYFLTMGRHLTEDLPRLLDEIRPHYPDLTLRASPPLDGHPQLAEILAARARDLLADCEPS